MNEVIDLFLDQMNNHTGRTIDLAEWIQFFAFDVVGELAFSKNWGLLKAGKDEENVMHLVFSSLSSKAVLGWTPMYGDATRFWIVRKILNSGYLRNINKVMDAWPTLALRKVCVPILSPSQDGD